VSPPVELSTADRDYGPHSAEPQAKAMPKPLLPVRQE